MEPYMIIIIVFSIFILWIVFTYNSFINLKNYVKKSFSGIDVQLKRRADLIPNLIETVKAYTKHESTILKEVTQARTKMMDAREHKDIKKMANCENQLQNALKSLFMVSENYPDLKANKNFLDLQNQLKNTEDQIAASRRIYNNNVTQYNIKTESFPSLIIARIFSFKEETLFETDNSDKKNINIKEHIN
jgi:LemA protein